MIVRFFLTFALFLCALGVLRSESPAQRPVRLTVQPMAEPKPALKYRFLPEVRELNPGNPAQGYLRCFAEQRYFFFSKQGATERETLRSMPLAKLKQDQVRNYGGSALRFADWSARLDALDWQMATRVQSSGMELVLPELEPLRVLAAALQVRFRGEASGKRYDDAVRSAKTMFMLARHLGEYPAGAANRIGVSIAHLTLDTLEETLQQPDCPNFYWALTDLPVPLVEIRKGVQGDCTLVATDMKQLHDDEAMTDAEIEKFVSRLSGLIGLAREQVGKSPRRFRAELAERVKDEQRVRAARKRLFEVKPGLNFLQRLYLSQKFSSSQVILLDEKHAYEIHRDEDEKLLSLAPWQIDTLKVEKKENAALFRDLPPSVLPIRWEQGRLEQRIALLRVVEALRLCAAAHGGKWPEKLTQCSVPLPDDPFTGKPFDYKIADAVVQLRGRGPDAIHYEVSLHK